MAVRKEVSRPSGGDSMAENFSQNSVIVKEFLRLAGDRSNVSKNNARRYDV